MTPAEAAQSYRMQAKQEEKAELEAILEQVRLEQPFWPKKQNQSQHPCPNPFVYGCAKPC